MSTGNGALAYGHVPLKDIGDFFVNLTVHLFGGTAIAVDGKQGGDVDHPDWNAVIEVKGASSTNGISVFHEQLDDYLEELGRRREHCYYALYRYDNSHRRERISATDDLREALARRTKELYIIDARLLDGLRRQNKTHMYRRRGEETATLDLRLHKLQRLLDDPAPTVRAAGFRMRNFVVMRAAITTVFEQHPMHFTSAFVIPRRLRESILRTIATASQLSINFT